MLSINEKRLPIKIIILVWMLTSITIHQGWAASAKSKYFVAERCHRQLLQHPDQQKYRDRWLRCINGFLAAHKQEPRGVWASASLYQAGALYAQMYTHSYFEGDKQEALDIFDRLIRGYPQSRYRQKALEARKTLLEGNQAGKSISSDETTARTFYKRALAAFQRLQKNPKLKKYRDQWFRCIDNYEKAFQADTKGPLAAASLSGLADSYEELSRYSFSQSDRDKAQEAYEQLIADFPDSEYAQKVKSDLNQGGDVGLDTSTGDGQSNDGTAADDRIAHVIEGSTSYEPVQDITMNMATSEDPAVVEGLRFWSNPRYTRVVIDANRDTIFTHHELREDPAIGKPQRIYIDMHNSRLDKNLQKVVPINDNLLKDARAGQYAQDTVRVVVDIKSFKTFKIFSLKNPFRVVLDVWGLEPDTGNVATQEPLPSTVVQNGKKIQPSAIAKQLALGVRRIVIDPGHGGKDYGAPGYKKGVHEKMVVLQIARRLKEMVRDQLKCEAILTRESDKYLSLEERTAIANTQNADLFVSIHTNASADHRAFGVETYILNLATDDEAIRVAAMENATSAKNISDLDSILQDLMQNAKVNESTRLAGYVQQAMHHKLSEKYDRIRNKGIKQAPFYVLLGADMPSILVETSFISNPRECSRLTSARYQKQLCQGIIDGIKRYMKETNPLAFQDEVPGKTGG
jgi:N-acetylmuramoyl-L-alanine amidase